MNQQQSIHTAGAAVFSLIFHGALGLALMWSWQPLPAKPGAQTVIQAQIYQPPPPAPMAPPPAAPAAEPEVTPEQLQAAEWARKRVEQEQKRKQREQLAEQERRKRERLAQEQRERERQQREREARALKEQQQREIAEQERLRQQKLAAAQAAEEARLAAERWAANNRNYAPRHKPKPDYPSRALDRGIEGDCTVEYTVTHEGRVANPKIVGQCHPLFMQPSLQAAAAFVYQPQLVDGKAQSVSGVRNTFHYKIE